MIKFEPIIKWSGSKRHQVNDLIKHFPINIDTYYEPFIGGGSMMRALTETPQIHVNHIVCSDINNDLINTWNSIKEQPNDLYEHYVSLWNELNKDDNKGRKRDYFNEVRARYNKEHNPFDFFFIMRTTTNGMPRYNSKGDFNNSFHITRNGITPLLLKPIVFEWSQKLNERNVEFLCRSYEDVSCTENDFIYMDPPYANTKGMYFGGFDVNAFYEFLKTIHCYYMFSFNGKSGDVDNTVDVPKHIYDNHLYIMSGNSSFKRVMGNSNDSIVYESLYLKNKGNRETLSDKEERFLF